MTPQNPWRRTWRAAVHPLLWWVAFILVMFVAVDASLARADATPAASLGETYAEQHAADICGGGAS